MVASTEFQVAAASQADAIGFEPAVVWVPHPIQNRSPDELKHIAEQALEPILAMLVSAPAQSAAAE